MKNCSFILTAHPVSLLHTHTHTHKHMRQDKHIK